jgi:hypothetical protein
MMLLLFPNKRSQERWGLPDPNAQVTGRPPAEGGESDELGEHDGR